MEYRSGKCSQCGAEYKIPASFAHNHARCKVCKGVVRLEPVQAQKSRAAAEPADPRTSPAAPRPSRVEPAAPRAEASVPGTPEDRASEQAPAPPLSAKPERPAREERAEPAAPAVRRADPQPVHARASEKSAAPARKQPPRTLLLAGGVLLVVAAALILFRGKIFGQADAPGSTVPTGTPESAPLPGAGEPGAGSDGSAGSERSEKTSATPREHLPSEPAPEKARARDPSSIDLAAVPDFGPTPDTKATEWTQMKTWATQWLDAASGAAGTRAKQELMAQQRKAVPVILNLFKRQDFATKQGRNNGDQCQKALMQICNGKTFDWRYADEAAGRPTSHPDDVWFCKHVAEQWIEAWKPCEQSVEAWIKLARLNEEDPAEAQRLRERFGGQSSTDPGGRDPVDGE